MDLLVLADSTGAVDMTPEAISRRTNVPQPEVEKYIKDLCQPDARSRSDLHEGKRLIPLDERRDWGWLIVNYSHYRQIKDEEARRTYFRNAQRQYRKGKKVVKDKGLTKFNSNGQVLTPASSSSSASSLQEVREFTRGEGICESDAEWFWHKCEGSGWMNNGKSIKNWKAVLRSWQKAKYLPSQKQQPNSRPTAQSELDKRLERDPLWQELQQGKA